MTALQLPEQMGSDFNLVTHCRSLGINETALLPEPWQSCPEESYTVPCTTTYLTGLPDQWMSFRCCP